MAGKERLEDGRLVIRHPSGKVELVESEGVPRLWVVNGRPYNITKPEDRQDMMRLAQLGARVLEILRDTYTAHGIATAGLDGAGVPITEGLDPLDKVAIAARSLGLLGKEDDQ